MYESFPTTRFSAFVLSLWTACLATRSFFLQKSKANSPTTALQQQQLELKKGIPDKFVMQRTGHRDVRSLQKYQRPETSTKIEFSKNIDSQKAPFWHS